ncbi:MAG: hypothetical protein EB127_14170 [Alphaproteobacteria bacterium]|nr:hypothetical protein [Alphaproteobacteria bacterium]
MKGGWPFSKTKVAPAPTASITTFDTYINDFINKSIADRLNIKLDDISVNLWNSEYTTQIVDKYSELVEAEYNNPFNAGAIVYDNSGNILNDMLLPDMGDVVYTIYPVGEPDTVLSQFRCKPNDKENICNNKKISELVNFIANRKLRLELSGLAPDNRTQTKTVEMLYYNRMITNLRAILRKEVFFIIINILYRLHTKGEGLSGDGVMNFIRNILDNVENEVDDKITKTEDLIKERWDKYEKFLKPQDSENQRNLGMYNKIMDTVVYLKIVIMKLRGSSRTSNLLSPYNNTLFSETKEKSTPSTVHNSRASRRAARKSRNAARKSRNAARTPRNAPPAPPPTKPGFIRRCINGICSLFKK